jgi:hypothetical protein
VCAPRYRQALEMAAALGALTPAAEPPRRLRRRLLASVGAERTGWQWTAAWAAVTSCLVLALLWVSIQDRRHAGELRAARDELRQTAASLARAQAGAARLEDALTLLEEPETRQVIFGGKTPQPPRGRVFVNPRRGVVLVASNLPPAPPGRIYEMWLVPKSGAPRPAGLFQSAESGSALHLYSGPVDLAATAAVAVTIEPESGSPAPTTTPLFAAAL